MHAGGGMGAEDEGVSFAHALATLKERGSALLVVGSVPEELFADASATMLGDPTADPPRRRLVVTPKANEESAIERLRATGPISSEYARLVTHGEAARSTAADAGSLGGATPRTHVVDGTLTDLGTTVADIIEEFDLFAGGLEPAAFRMAFDCLPTLLSLYDRETVFRFLHVLIAQSRAAGGLAHFRLPQDVDAEPVRLFEPLFDAMVELGLDGDDIVQRWHFRDRDLVSDWLPLNHRR